MTPEGNDIEALLYHPGWTILENEIKAEFNKKYKQLRKCLKDATFYKVRGELDALEWVLKLPELIKSRGEL